MPASSSFFSSAFDALLFGGFGNVPLAIFAGDVVDSWGCVILAREVAHVSGAILHGVFVGFDRQGPTRGTGVVGIVRAT